MAAKVTGAGMGEVTIPSEDDVGEVEEGGQLHGYEGEDKVEDHADSGQGKEIKGGIAQRQQLQHVINGGKGQQEQSPYGTEEGAEQGWLRERIQRGMVEELHPLLGLIMLNNGVEKGCNGECDAEQRGVHAGDIIKQQHAKALATQDMKQHHEDNSTHDDKEPEDVTVGEEEDELADGVVGAGGLKEFALVEPTHRELIARHLDPHAINRILRNDGEGGNDNGIAAPHPQAITPLHSPFTPMHGALLEQQKAVSTDKEVIAYAIGPTQLQRATVRHIGFGRIQNDMLGRIVAGREGYHRKEGDE